MFGLFKKKQLPKKILILSALPETKDSFYEFAKRGTSDFIRSLVQLYGVDDVESLWKHYKPSAHALQSTYKEVESRGGRIISNFSLNDLYEMKHYDVVVIIAHHSDDSDHIEIGGNMVRTIDFVHAIPENIQVVLDLTSCYSAYLIPKIKGHIPMSKIIGIEVKTKLAFRLFLLEKVLEHLSKTPNLSYLEALSAVLSKLPTNSSEVEVKDNSPEVHLGGALLSTVYAPREAKKGEDFIVSVFMHKASDMNEVELIAKSMDEKMEKRTSKRLSVKVKKGDRVDFQFSIPKQNSDSFIIDKRIKGFVWDGDVNSVEFVVSVLTQCSTSSLVGRIKICVNKEPVADMVFTTSIVPGHKTSEIGCADFDFIPFDKKGEMEKANLSLLSRLSDKIDSLNKQITDTGSDVSPELLSELDMCMKCKELLVSPHIKNSSNILKVFISSTSDMKLFRQIMKERVEACEMYPVMYENWGQGSDYPRDMCCKYVLDSDIFVCILGAKYGYIEPIWGKSMTEIEYRVALNAGIPILIYVMSNYKEEMERLNEDEKLKAVLQEHLIDEMKTQRMVGIFPNELSLSLLANSELLTVKQKILS